jgi:hypothetical protein
VNKLFIVKYTNTMSTESKQKVDKGKDDRYIFNPRTKRYVLKDRLPGKEVQKQMSRSELVKHINMHATSEMVKHRGLLRSDLSDDELAKILTKLVDLKITEHIAQSNLLPHVQPKLVRTRKPPLPNGQKRPRGRPRKNPPVVSRSRVQSPPPSKSKKRFVLKPPPQTPCSSDVDETTDFQTTDAYDTDSEISD